MKRIYAFFLISLVLVSNLGISASTHFCGEIVVDSEISIGHQQLDCGMNMGQNVVSNLEDSCPNQDMSEPSCCRNEYASYSIEDDFRAVEADLVFKKSDVTITPESFPHINELINLLFPDRSLGRFSSIPESPIIEIPFRVLFQVFRI